MPGIVGVISREASSDCQALLERMIARLGHESSYVAGSVSFPELGFCAGWTAHPGSFGARHSGYDERSGIALAFSGECFEDGHVNATARRSWIIREYERVGDACFQKLNGLFSGLLIDRRRHRAFLFSDRYGVERIYYYQTNDKTYFASEAKAILEARPELRAFDGDGVAQYLAFGCTMGERTLFQGVSLLPGATCWEFGPHGMQKKGRYFDPGQWETQETLGEEQFDRQFSETFQRIIPRYTEDKECVGVALTGGLDTRMIMACLPRTATRHPCYTFIGETGLTLDARLAAKIAAARGLEHQALRVEPDFLRDFETHLDRTVYVTDGYAGATSSHEIYFNAQARTISPVRLTGNFGSEIFRSVSTFKSLGLEPRLLSEACRDAVASEVQQASGSSVHPVTFSAFREIPWSLFGLLAAGRSQLTFRTPYLDNDLVALAYRAPASRRLSPLLAMRLIREANPQLACIPTDRGELLNSSALARAFRRAYGELTFKLDYFHKEGLPTFLSRLDPLLNSLAPLGVLGLHKFLPYRRWFRKELAPLVMERLSSRRIREAPWWTRNAPGRLARKHKSGQGNYVRELNAVLTLEAIDRLFFKEVPLANSVERQRRVEVAT